MRVLTPLLLLTLSAYAQAETLPSFLNSNDTVRTLPVPNLPLMPTDHPRRKPRYLKRRRLPANRC